MNHLPESNEKLLKYLDHTDKVAQVRGKIPSEVLGYLFEIIRGKTRKEAEKSWSTLFNAIGPILSKYASWSSSGENQDKEAAAILKEILYNESYLALGETKNLGKKFKFTAATFLQVDMLDAADKWHKEAQKVCTTTVPHSASYYIHSDGSAPGSDGVVYSLPKIEDLRKNKVLQLFPDALNSLTEAYSDS